MNVSTEEIKQKVVTITLTEKEAVTLMGILGGACRTESHRCVIDMLHPLLSYTISIRS